MTHTISDKQVTINGMTHTVTAVEGLDRVEINNKLHDLNEQTQQVSDQNYWSP